MIVRNICCFGADKVNCLFSSVIAYKCPELDVYVIDLDKKKLMKWNSLDLPFLCNDMRNFVLSCRHKNLFFTTKVSRAIKQAELIFLSVAPQPVVSSKGKIIDLKPLEDAARVTARFSVSPKIVVENSPISVRAAELVQTILEANAQPNAKFFILSNPQIILEETIMTDLLFPERVLIGGGDSRESKAAVDALISIYGHWVPYNKIFTSDTWSMELAKLVMHPLLAQRMTSINSLSELCESMNVDMSEVAAVMGMDSRVGLTDLTPSIGFGGPFLRKSLLTIIYFCNNLNLPKFGAYWQKVLDMNEYLKKRFANKISQVFFGRLEGKYLAIFGFSFKRNTKFTTDSPAISVCSILLQEGAKLKIYDPVVPKSQILKELMEKCEQSKDELEKSMVVTDDAYEAAVGAHAILICTNWDEFLHLDYTKMFSDMKRPAYIFDGWNMLPHHELKKIGFTVHTIGTNLEQNPTSSNRE